MGRVVPERNQPHIREIVVSPYRIVYRLRKPEKLVEVLRVWHGARGKPEIQFAGTLEISNSIGAVTEADLKLCLERITKRFAAF